MLSLLSDSELQILSLLDPLLSVFPSLIGDVPLDCGLLSEETFSETACKIGSLQVLIMMKMPAEMATTAAIKERRREKKKDASAVDYIGYRVRCGDVVRGAALKGKALSLATIPLVTTPFAFQQLNPPSM